MLLSKGINCCGANSPNSRQFTDFVSRVTEHINKTILGSARCRAQWRFPKNDKGELGKVSLNNCRARRVVTNLDSLVDVVFMGDGMESTCTAWKDAIASYRSTISMARQREEFSDHDIEVFQNVADDFYVKWIALHGQEGITNYIHMVGAGHILHYIRVHRNLYKFSQQGWESLNLKIKALYFRSMQRGGFGSKSQSHILPIIWFLQCELMWKTGLAQKFFLA